MEVSAVARASSYNLINGKVQPGYIMIQQEIVDIYRKIHSKTLLKHLEHFATWIQI